jgi:hypothetical protein
MGPAASAVNPEQGGSMAYAGLFARDAAQAAKYAQFRPKYSADLYAAIISYMDVGPLTGRSAVGNLIMQVYARDYASRVHTRVRQKLLAAWFSFCS